jgi:kynurenine formamidase
MTLHDLTRPLPAPDAAGWAEEPADFALRYRFRYRRDFSLGDSGSQGELWLDEHYGTHVDAPSHVLAGAPSVEAMDLSRLHGPAVVLDCRDRRGSAITAAVLAERGADVRPGDIVLVCSAEPDPVPGVLPVVQTHVTVDAARWLVEHRVAAVGVETLGLEHVHDGLHKHRYWDPAVRDPWPAHRECLAHDVYVVEGLTGLAPLAGRRVRFSALPLPVTGGSGCPVRAVAW